MIRRLFTLVPLLHLYVGLRLLPDLPLTAFGLLGGIIVLLLSAALIPLAMLSRRMPDRRRADRLAWAGFVAMGLFSSVLVLTVVRDLCLLAGAAAGLVIAIEGGLRSFRHWSAIAVPLLALALTAVGFVNARRRAAVRSVEVAIDGLPGPLHGFTIAQITDVHVGPTIKRGYLDAIVEAVNALEADLIAVTGDMVDGSVGELAWHLEPLSRLAARHGSFFVTGNHEYYSGVHGWLVEIERLGLRVLMNEHVVLDHRGASMVVAGVSDFHAEYFDPAQKSDPAAAIAGAPVRAGMKLLLAHQPRSAFEAARAGFDLQLSGHTHGGQFAPWMFLVRMQQPFTAGLHRVDKLWVYTSRGAGYWGPPKRFWAPSEITCIRLVSA